MLVVRGPEFMEGSLFKLQNSCSAAQNSNYGLRNKEFLLK